MRTKYTLLELLEAELEDQKKEIEILEREEKLHSAYCECEWCTYAARTRNAIHVLEEKIRKALA